SVTIGSILLRGSAGPSAIASASAWIRSRSSRSSATKSRLFAGRLSEGYGPGDPSCRASGPRSLTRCGTRLNNVAMPRLAAVALAVLLLAPSPAAAAGQTPLARKLSRALAVPHVSKARTSALAVDLATGRPVYARNLRLPLIPASNEKLAVTYASLLALGPSFRFSTDVLGEGELEGTLWRGDVVLKGYGDPTLSTLDLLSLASQLRRGPCAHRHRRRLRGSARDDRVGAAHARPALHGPRERQLHGRDAPQATRRRRRPPGDDRGRRAGGAPAASGAADPVDWSADRRRLRPVPSRPSHDRGRRRDAPLQLARRGPARAPDRRAARRRPERHARLPDARDRGRGARAREDGDAERGVCLVRLRAAPLRVLRDPELAGAGDLRGTARPG